jgi:DNA invertase Pin-like site-specific DNA recombinase
MVRRSLKDRIQQARSLGLEVYVYEGGNDKIAVVYARVSGPQQAINSIYSLRRQRGLATQAMEMKYDAVVVIFMDTSGISGALGPEDRPGFKQLCELIEREIADDVFVMDFTRLVREKVIGLEFAALCVKHHVTIIDETGRVLDPADEIGLILYVVELTKSVGERHRINSRLQVSRRLKAEEGRNPGTNIPTGYYILPGRHKTDPDHGEFLVYEPHAQFVRFVFDQLLKLGNSPRRILKACRKAGFDTIPPFEPEEVRRYMETRTSLLKTERDEEGNYVVSVSLITSLIRRYEWYMGVFRWGENSQWGPPIRIENNHEPVIDSELRPEIERTLACTRPGSSSKRGVLPLSNLVYSFTSDGEVAPLEYAISTGYARRYIFAWEYNRSIPGSKTWSLTHHLLEEPVFAVVLSRILLPDYAAEIAEELEGNRQRALEAAARFRETRERLTKEIKNLQSNFALISHPDDMASINKQIAERRNRLEELAAESENQVVGHEVMSVRDINTYREFLADLPRLWETADDELRNRFLSVVLEGVYIRLHSTCFDLCIAWYNGDEDYLRVHIPPRYRSYRKEWTTEDEDFLRANYATMDLEALQEALDCSERAFRLRAFKLGLKRPHVKPQPWTPEERAILEKYSRSELSYEQMREALAGRTEAVIFSRLKDWGLQHPESPYWETLPSSYGEQFASFH